MPPRRPKIVVFDVGAVLIDWNPEHLYRRMIPDPERRRFFLTEVFPPSVNLQGDGGRPFADIIAERTGLYPDFAAEIAAWFHRWPEMVDGEIAGAVALFRRLQAGGVPLYAITNFSAETWPIACARWPILTEFAGVAVSGELKICKPDLRIYAWLIREYGLQPADCLFVDDREENCEGARRAGMHAVLFRDPETLASDLESHGLLPAVADPAAASV